MKFFDTTGNTDFNNITYTDSTLNFRSQLFFGASATTIDPVIIPEQDWMPYKFFEYDPLWHKKYAAIKFQMDTMWD